MPGSGGLQLVCARDTGAAHIPLHADALLLLLLLILLVLENNNGCTNQISNLVWR
jgi:hypothetical protein